MVGAFLSGSYRQSINQINKIFLTVSTVGITPGAGAIYYQNQRLRKIYFTVISINLSSILSSGIESIQKNIREG